MEVQATGSVEIQEGYGGLMSACIHGRLGIEGRAPRAVAVRFAYELSSFQLVAL